MSPAGQLLADSDVGKGSPIGLLVVLVLVVAVYFLWRSMNRHLKKVQAPSEQQYQDQFGTANSLEQSPEPPLERLSEQPIEKPTETSFEKKPAQTDITPPGPEH